MPSGDNIAHGCDPRPPALETAIARALPCEPAIGAWMTGNSMPIRFASCDIRRDPYTLDS
jgi:hypothetical protein